MTNLQKQLKFATYIQSVRYKANTNHVNYYQILAQVLKQ
jgi:hypothetical protein